MKMENNLSITIENIQPILPVADMERSILFYTDVLGFAAADWGNERFTMVQRNNCGIYLSKDGQGNAGTWVWVGFEGDIWGFYQYLIKKGVTPRQPPVNFSWALELLVEDPDGHVLRFGTTPNPDKPYMDQQSEPL